jgi:hypothetical protein
MLGGEHLYVIQMAVTGAFKVGRTSNVDRRLRELQTGAPHRLRLLLLARDQGHRERAIHERLSRYRCRIGSGEWFHEDGIGELPDNIYECIPVETLEDVDWWQNEGTFR